MDTLFVDLPHFLLPLHTVTSLKTERSFSPHGLKRTSVPAERDGGTKPESYYLFF